MAGYMKKATIMDKKCNKKIPCDCKEDIDCIKRKIPNEPLLLLCGQGVDAQFTSPESPDVNVGSVIVDTTCLCKPLVKIKFSSVVNFASAAAAPEALVDFRLIRTCEDGNPVTLDTWTYEVFQISDNTVPLTFNTSFTFIFCDRLNCSKCCSYVVEASVGNLSLATVTVTNVHIQAIAQ